METATIGLIGEVNTTLTGAATVLADIQESLSTTAGELGQRTISDLQASTSALTGSLQGVAGDITSLESEITGTLDGTSSKLMTQLQGTLDRVKGLLGDPANAKGPTEVAQTDRCAVRLPGYEKDAELSVYQHILQVQARLEALQTASGRCGAAIEDTLVASLGKKGMTQAECDAIRSEDRPALCVMATAQRQVGDEFTRLTDLQAALQGYNGDFQNIATLVDDVISDAQEAEAAALTLASADGTVIDETVQDLELLEAALGSLDAALDAPELATAFATLNTNNGTATTEMRAVTGLLSEAEGTALKNLGALACDQPTTDPTTPPPVQTYLDKVAG
jgi:hypothetical protein